jgi:glycerophosphoryl diester phosphodiesterase
MKQWLIIFLFVHRIGLTQTPPHVNAHAHNDYEHTHPLFDALEHGFTSIEADVHLINGRLLVSHDRPNASAKTLEALYLKPLDSIRKATGGWIYPQHPIPVFLMIDIKTKGEETFLALVKTLSTYQEALNIPKRKGAIQVFISGNRPIELIRNDPQHLSAIDGRPEDLEKGFSSDEMPVISENYKKIMKWDRNGPPPHEELNRIKELASKVHKENKKLRLWGIPDNENTWQVLLDAGVDLINTDKLRELSLFLTSKKL